METTAEYKLVKDTHKLEKLEQIVSEMIANGWKPVGGIAFNNGFAYQAMARLSKSQKAEVTKPPRESPKETTREAKLRASQVMGARYKEDI
tara:strand:+ start:447 stop:719 length:273 start_codon:yes stop_codon:yes gene_type:complete